MNITDNSTSTVEIDLDVSVRIDITDMRRLISGDLVRKDGVSIQYTGQLVFFEAIKAKESPIDSLERWHNEDRLKKLEGGNQ